MKRYDILRLEDIVDPDWPKQSFNDGPWYPAEPREYGGMIQRFLSAWEVFRGRARAVTWPNPHNRTQQYQSAKARKEKRP